MKTNTGRRFALLTAALTLSAAYGSGPAAQQAEATTQDVVQAEAQNATDSQVCDVMLGETVTECVLRLAGDLPAPSVLGGDFALEYESALTLQFEDGTFVKGDSAWLMIDESAASSSQLRPEEGGSGHQRRPIYCSVGNYTFRDRNGTYDLRYNCAYDNSQWSFRMSPSLVSICRGTVHEYGAVWYRNDRYVGKNAEHFVPCDYRFHGTFSYIYNQSNVDWYDTLNFDCYVNGKRCRARLNIGGSYQTFD